MERLDALSAENRQMIWTVKVLYSFIVLLAYFVWETLFVFFVKVKTCLREYGVFWDDFVENVNVQGKSFGSFKLFDQLSTNWTTDTVFMMELLDAAGAESVTAVDENARDSLPNIILKPAELANVKTARLIVQIHQVGSSLIANHLSSRKFASKVNANNVYN